MTANDVVSVAAVSKDGTVLQSVDVRDSVYELVDVPYSDDTSIAFTHENGAVTTDD